MKKFLPILLITLISLNTFGFNLFIGFMVYECKIDSDSENYFNNSEVKIFKLSSLEKNKIQRFEDDEIKYEDCMYDIIRKEKKNNEVYIYCISDEKENDLIKMFLKFNLNKDQNDKNRINYIQKNLIKNYISFNKFLEYTEDTSQLIDVNPNKSYLTPSKEVLLPPPNSSTKLFS